MTAIDKHISIITININGLNSPIKNTGWLKRSRNKIPTSVVYKQCNLDLKTGTTLKYKSVQQEAHQSNGTRKQAGFTILNIEKINFKLKLIGTDKGKHSILVKGTVNQDGTAILNIYVPNSSARNFIKIFFQN